MRLRHDPTAQEYLDSLSFYVKTDNIEKPLNMKNYFGNDKPIHIEVGSGRGKFITTLAKENPNINYIAVEKYPTVMKAIALKQEEMEIDNLLLMSFDAQNILDVFEKSSIDKVYLNFSDPWPKARHAKRRLTSINFLNLYKEILNGEKIVEFKTDNQVLIDFTLETLEENHIEIIKYINNLHETDEKNIKTEYEEKFSAKGFNIHKVIFKLCEL